MDNKVHTIYRLADGTRVPSVTTFLGILAKPALIEWAWKLGVQGLDYKKVRDQASGTGTLVHYLILCDLKGQEPELGDYSPNDLVTTAEPMKKYQEWKSKHKLEPVLLETPLVSEVFRFGGTPDYYGLLDKVATLLDFKTSREIYQENFYQLAAYRRMLIENSYAVNDCRVIRIGKSADEGFEERVAGNLDNHFELFRACQKIYTLQGTIRKNKEG